MRALPKTVPTYTGNGRANYVRKFYGSCYAVEEAPVAAPKVRSTMSLADYINIHGYIRTDARLRDGDIRIQYRGNRAVVVELGW